MGVVRILEIPKMELRVTIVNGLQLLTIAARVHLRCGMGPRFASKFSEIPNDKLLTHISYSYILLLLAHNNCR